MTTSDPPALEIVLSKAASESISTTFIVNNPLLRVDGDALVAIRDPKNAVDVKASATAAKATTTRRRATQRVILMMATVYNKQCVGIA